MPMQPQELASIEESEHLVGLLMERSMRAATTQKSDWTFRVLDRPNLARLPINHGPMPIPSPPTSTKPSMQSDQTPAQRYCLSYNQG
jgi:hypothetical protein